MGVFNKVMYIKVSRF